MAVTGWSRANTRRAIATTNKRRGPERAVTRKVADRLSAAVRDQLVTMSAATIDTDAQTR